MKMLLVFLLFVITLILEVGFFSRQGFLGLYPNFVLMFLMSSFFIISEIWIFIMALLGFLIITLYMPILWGIVLLPVFIIFIALYLLHKYIFTNINVFVIFLMSLISTFIYNSFLIVIYMFVGQKINFNYILNSFIFLILINFIFALIVYFFIKSFWENYLKKESFSRLLR